MPPPEASIISALTFSPDGKTLVVGGRDAGLHLFQSDGKYLRSLPGHSSAITGVIVHPAGAVTCTVPAARGRAAVSSTITG